MGSTVLGALGGAKSAGSILQGAGILSSALGGLFGGGDDADTVGDNYQAYKLQKMEDSKYKYGVDEAYDWATKLAQEQYDKNRFNQISPYGSMTWYNANSLNDAQDMAKQDMESRYARDIYYNLGEDNSEANALFAKQLANEAMNGTLDQRVNAFQTMQNADKLYAARDAYNQQQTIPQVQG